MLTPKLFCTLPDYISTPDGMAIDKQGNLVLSCPNFAGEEPGVVVKIDKEGNVKKWFEVPVHPETGVARNMGISFDDEWNLIICDNQGWNGKDETKFKGRMLKVTVDDEGNISKCVTVATGMEHPNGVRVKDGYMYLTQSTMEKVKDESGLLVSCVYKFSLDDENIQVTNTLDDPNIIATFLTHDLADQYGADGIVFDKKGNLYVGNFGDGTVYRIRFNADGSVKDNLPWARNRYQLRTTDGLAVDDEDNIYIADFSDNAICRITPEREVQRIAQSPDSDGLKGELNQPGEPIAWNNWIIASCFDLVTGPTKVNTGHSMPATLSKLELKDLA